MMTESETKNTLHPSRKIDFSDNMNDFVMWWDVFRECTVYFCSRSCHECMIYAAYYLNYAVYTRTIPKFLEKVMPLRKIWVFNPNAGGIKIPESTLQNGGQS